MVIGNGFWEGKPNMSEDRKLIDKVEGLALILDHRCKCRDQTLYECQRCYGIFIKPGELDLGYLECGVDGCRNATNIWKCYLHRDGKDS